MKLRKMLSLTLAISMTAGSMLGIAPSSAQAADKEMQNQQSNLAGGVLGIRGVVQYFLTCPHQQMQMSMT